MISNVAAVIVYNMVTGSLRSSAEQSISSEHKYTDIQTELLKLHNIESPKLNTAQEIRI